MILRPFSINKVQKFMNDCSPKGTNKLKYIRLKNNKQKNAKVGRSLCSIQTNRTSNNKRIMSHRKLISVSSLDQKQNLTDRNRTVQTQNLKSFRNLTKQQGAYLNKKKFHLNKFYNFRGDRLNTIQNQQCQNMEKVLQIKQNILKQFIDRFQQQLRQISQQKSSRNTLLTHRLKTQGQRNQTTKKQRRPMIQLQSNNSTINLNISQEKKKYKNEDIESEENKFQDYIKQIQCIKNKDKKILIMKNQKKSIQNISISKIGQTQNITARISKKQNMNNNNKLNLKQLFRHSKKYEPYFKQSSTVSCIAQNNKNNNQIQQIKQNQQNEEISILSPVNCKQENKRKPLYTQQIGTNRQSKKSINRQPKSLNRQLKSLNRQDKSMNKQERSFYKQKQSGYVDCSSIQKINQSSFISEIGRNSILKHLQNQSIKIVKNQQRKSKKCLAKMKNIFPSDFF